MSKDFIELKIIDDDNYVNYIKDYLTYCIDTNENDNFIDTCENPMLFKALKSLSYMEMTVIFLMFEKEFTTKEISKILKIYSESVSRIKARALKKLKKFLEDGDFYE